MRVLIYEPQYVGHNLTYVNYLASELIELGCEVHLVTSRASLASEEFASHLGHLQNDLHCLAIDGFKKRSSGAGVSVNGIKGTRSLLNGLWQGLHSVQPDHLYIPCGNAIAHWMGLPNRISRHLRQHAIESEIVLLFGKYACPHQGLRAYIKEKLALAALERGPWSRVHHILPRAVRVMSAFSPKLAVRVRYLPDPVDPPISMTHCEARRMLGVPELGRYVALVGLIEKRKGIFQLLEAFERSLGKLRDGDRILLAGKSTDEVRGVLANQYRSLVESGRVIALDRQLTRTELWAACNAADVVATPYPDHLYSASIVFRAAAVNRFVLANDIGWMGETIHAHGLGLACDTNDGRVFADKLVQSLEVARDFAISDEARQFIQLHSQANFAHQLTARLRSRLMPTAKIQRYSVA